MRKDVNSSCRNIDTAYKFSNASVSNCFALSISCTYYQGKILEKSNKDDSNNMEKLWN